MLQSRHQVDPEVVAHQKMNPVFQAEEVLQKKTQAEEVHQRMIQVEAAGEPQKTIQVEVVAAGLQRMNQVWEEALPRNLRVVVETCRAPKGHCSGNAGCIMG